MKKSRLATAAVAAVVVGTTVSPSPRSARLDMAPLTWKRPTTS